MGITNFDTIRAENGFKTGDTDFPTSQTTEKTIGAGKDFETLREALNWQNTLVQGQVGYIIFTLDDGVHYIGELTDFNDWAWTYHQIRMDTTFKSASGDKSLCTIVPPADDDGDNYPPLFSVSACFVNFTDITLSASVGGSTGANKVSCVYVNNGAGCQFNNCDLYDFDDAIYAFSNSHVNLIEYSSKGFIVDGCTRAVVVVGGSTTFIDSAVVLSNNALGIYTQDAGACVSKGTMTTNTQDYTGTINEIQYDGSYVTNGTSAMSFKS